MALTFLRPEEIKYLIPWDESPRLPKSIQDEAKSLEGDDKMNFLLNYYADKEEIDSLMGSISSMGLFPGEPLHVINNNGEETVFDGIRRFMAIKAILEPEKVNNTRIRNYAIELRNGMDEESLEALENPHIMAYHPSFYTIHSAQMEIAKQMFSDFDDIGDSIENEMEMDEFER